MSYILPITPLAYQCQTQIETHWTACAGDTACPPHVFRNWYDAPCCHSTTWTTVIIFRLIYPEGAIYQSAPLLKILSILYWSTISLRLPDQCHQKRRTPPKILL